MATSTKTLDSGTAIFSPLLACRWMAALASAIYVALRSLDAAISARREQKSSGYLRSSCCGKNVPQALFDKAPWSVGMKSVTHGRQTVHRYA